MAEPVRSRAFSRSEHLDQAHNKAICHEIGERLRIALDRDQSPLPARLREMLERFQEMDALAPLTGRKTSD